MRERDSHLRPEAKRRALESLDSATIMGSGSEPEEEAKKRKHNGEPMVGTGRFELPTPRTPSECSTRLSHVPTRKEPAASLLQRMGLTQGF
jgi:hypothetical protein